MPIDIGSIILGVIISGIIAVALNVLGIKNELFPFDKKTKTYIYNTIFTLFGATLNFYFGPELTVSTRIVNGGIYGFIGGIIFISLLNWIRIKSLKYRTDTKLTPIEKLNVEKDYINILKESNIAYIEVLLEDKDLQELAEDSGLQIETLIEFREKAKRIKEK